MAERAEDFSYEVHRDCDLDSEYNAVSDHDGPVHPVAAMQEAFEESIQEAVDGDMDGTMTTRPDAEARRRDILDKPTYDPSWRSRWKQKPNARCHPIVKLMSQIIFGLHLLHQRQAKSDAAVVKILQVHVDEIDTFLEKTTEDFDLAVKDIEERISCLNLPMTHRRLFQKMLEDKTFRTQLMEGNGKIEQIIERTSNARGAALLDVEKALDTVGQLARYLDSVRYDWPHDTPEQEAIFFAMKGNEGGWRGCLTELSGKGHHLGSALLQLGTVINEMNRLAGAASRRSTDNDLPVNPVGAAKLQHDRTSHARPVSSDNVNKPLPKEPVTATPAIKATSQTRAPSFVPVPNITSRGSAPTKKLKKKVPVQLPSKTADFPSRHSNSTNFENVKSTSHHEAAESVPMPIYIPGQSRPQPPPVQYDRTAPLQLSHRPRSPGNHYPSSSQQRPLSPPQCSPRQAPQLPGFTFQEPLLRQFATRVATEEKDQTSANYTVPSPLLILQYPETPDRSSHNETSGLGRIRFASNSVSEAEEHPIATGGLPQTETHVRETTGIPIQQSFETSPVQASSSDLAAFRVQTPSDVRMLAQERRIIEQNCDSGQVHEDFQDGPSQLIMGFGSDVDTDACNKLVSDNTQVPSPDLSRSSRPKVDSAYALSSTVPATQVRSGSSSRAPSRLGLFPDTALSTPPQTSRQANGFGNANSPPRQDTASMDRMGHQPQPTVARKFSKLFSRKTRESQSYSPVLP